MNHSHCKNNYCPIITTIKLIGGKYKVVILWYISQGVIRFGELRRHIPDATAKMLTQQLRELENDNLITRKIYPVIPPKVEYRLTSFGKSIESIMKEMYKWGSAYLNKRGVKSSCDMYKTNK